LSTGLPQEVWHGTHLKYVFGLKCIIFVILLAG